jgi:putative ABC transport system permease protein
MPLRGLDFFTFSIVGKQAPAPDQRPTTGADEVSASFFDTLKIPLKKGRYLNDHDDAAAPWAIVINETFAQQYFPNEDPIGKQILLRFDPYPVDDDHPREIVGVVGNVKHFGLGRPDRPFVYTSFLQQPAAFPGGRTISHVQQELLVRTAPGLASAGSGFALTVRKTVAEVDPDQAVTDTTTMDKVVAESIGDAQFYAQLIGIFAAMAVLLAAIGIYGVISYSVNERTQEIGIRVALGAQSTAILGMVTKLGLLLVGLGVIVGGAAAMGLARLISIFLFGVKPSDPLTYVLVASALVAVALLACYIPARRASKVDPMVALRYQ